MKDEAEGRSFMKLLAASLVGMVLGLGVTLMVDDISALQTRNVLVTGTPIVLTATPFPYRAAKYANMRRDARKMCLLQDEVDANQGNPLPIEDVKEWTAAGKQYIDDQYAFEKSTGTLVPGYKQLMASVCRGQ